MQVYAQSDRKVKPTPINVRPMTRDEVLGLSGHANIILNNGRLGTVKINGAVKTWKTDPNRAEVPVKYGLYECARLSLDEALRCFVVIL